MQSNLTFGERLQRTWADPSIHIPVLIFIAARVLTLVVATTALRIGPVYNPYASAPIFIQSMEARQLSSPLTPFVDPWHRWDTGWYLKVAVKGYAPDDGSVIFTPLYPALMAVVGAVVGDKLLAGLLVSSAAALAFLIILYKLACLEIGSKSIAANTLLLLVSFPTAFYMMAGYTESTYLAFVGGTFLAARQKRWWMAAVLAGLAALTRPQGWVLFFPVGWLAFVEAPRFWQANDESWAERIRTAIPRLAAIGAAPLMVIVFFAYLYFSGLGTLTEAYEKYWSMTVRPPWSAVIDVIVKIAAGKASATEVAGLVALVFIVVMVVASIRRLPLIYHLYLWPTLILILLRYYPAILLNGTMRYVLDFFPIFITLAIYLTPHPRLRWLWIGISTLVEIFTLYLFARWLWIS